MKNLYLVLLVTIGLLSASSLKSAEIIPVWNRTATNGKIFDIEFMPSGEEFILSSSTGEIQIRSSLDGELIREHIDTTNLFMNGYFEFTPDSNRIVIVRSGLIQLVNLENFERLNYFAFGKDSVIKGFGDVVLDPIRPYAYVTLNGHSRETGSNDKRCKIQVYNYETMELVKDLTPYGEDDYTAIEVSHDGKYLATLNDHNAYLKVWNLETMELIINEPLFDPNSTDRCEAKDIYFSKINPDLIYYSGFFSKQINNKRQNGIFKYNIITRNIERIISDGLYDGHNMIFLGNETKIFNSTNGDISVLNLLDNNIEYYGDPDNIYETIVRYSKKDNYFIGSNYNNKLSKFLYDSQSGVNSSVENVISISPNPTSNFVSIELNCTDSILNYQINDTNGTMVLQSAIQNQNSTHKFDFSPYPSGVYFLSIICNNQTRTYKVIKEN